MGAIKAENEENIDENYFQANIWQVNLGVWEFTKSKGNCVGKKIHSWNRYLSANNVVFGAVITVCLPNF